ncbi:hypothetical protein [Ectobacillus ponti]|nr:hypothetical protein [Ectobacillus ponti]
MADSYARTHLENRIKLDYLSGFRIDTPNETLAYGLSVCRRKENA